MMPLWLAVSLALAALIIAVPAVTILQRKYNLTEYLFFTRYSTFFGLVLFFLPILGPANAPSMLLNVFVMGFWGVMLTGFAGTLYAWAVVYTFRLTWVTIPIRCQLRFRRFDREETTDSEESTDEEESSQESERAKSLTGWQREAYEIAQHLHDKGYVLINRKLALASSLLTVPLFWIAFSRADTGNGSAILALALGVAAAWLLRLLSDLLLTKKPEGVVWVDDVNGDNQTFLAWLGYDFGRAPMMKKVHQRAGRFFVSSTLIVIGLGLLYSPFLNPYQDKLPALVILLNVLMLLTWISSCIGFIFDKDRVPVTLVLILLTLGIQFFVRNEHVYRVSKQEQASFTAEEALRKRIGENTDEPLLVIAASGGGIRASLWTAYVMEQLKANTEKFDERIGLISSVSGGSVGSMYYYDQAYIRTGKEFDASNAAATSSLSALIWGFAYLEAPRLFLGSGVFGSWDRGLAQERAWEAHLPDQTSKTFDNVAADVRAGKIPLHIYNACFQESGQRYLISPATVNPPTNSGTEPKPAQLLPRLRNFQDLKRNMKLVTAARLSATFPYATPQAKAQDFDGKKKLAELKRSGGKDFEVSQAKVPAGAITGDYHAADGGYYDNSGLLTTIEILDAYLEKTKKGNFPKKIAIIEIRADAGDFAVQANSKPGGLKTELIGPALTAFHVVFGSQTARNRQEIRWLGQHWAKSGVRLQHYVFYLSAGPLSWHLSKAEITEIKSNWPTDLKPAKQEPETPPERARAFNLDQFQALQKFLAN